LIVLGTWLVGGIAIGLLAFFGLIGLVRAEIPATSDIWTVSAHFARLRPNWDAGGYGAWFDCDVEIRSKEVPSFAQGFEHGIFLGWHPGVIGGIHDWIVFYELRKWPRARRVALLEYLASRKNPLLLSAGRADSDFWQYALEEGYVSLPRDAVNRIGANMGVEPKNLYWLATDHPYRNEIVGFRTASGEFVRVTPVAPESVVSTFAPPAFVRFALALQEYEFSEPTTGTAWYPTYLPVGYQQTSLETTTLGDGQSPVCDVVFAKGDSKIYLTQGSPVMRDYEIVPITTVAWGTESAWTMDSDGETGGRRFIVYGDQRNLAELSGDVGIAELKKVAASMRPVP
jgi:hypothetical protein